MRVRINTNSLASTDNLPAFSGYRNQRAQLLKLGIEIHEYRPDPAIRSEWLLEPSLRGFNLQEAEATLRQILGYRVWFDQRRGWRYTNPNLEQLGMVEVSYLGLDELATDGEQAIRVAEELVVEPSPDGGHALIRCRNLQIVNGGPDETVTPSAPPKWSAWLWV